MFIPFLLLIPIGLGVLSLILAWVTGQVVIDGAAIAMVVIATLVLVLSLSMASTIRKSPTRSRRVDPGRNTDNVDSAMDLGAGDELIIMAEDGKTRRVIQGTVNQKVTVAKRSRR